MSDRRTLMAGIRLITVGLCMALISSCATNDLNNANPATRLPTNGSGHLAGKTSLTIAVKVDSPGLGEIVNGNPDDREGFEIDVAKYVARGLGVPHIAWRDVFSRDRIKVIENGEVDLVIASFAVSANRMDKISFAGPYLITGQDILVRTSDAATITGLASLKNKKVCSIVNSTSVERLVQEFGKAWDVPAHLVRLESTRQCINELLAGKVDAISTGNMIMAGYAAEQPSRLHLVNHPFTTDNVGIGLAKGDTEDIVLINKILQRMIDDGTWAASIKRHFGRDAHLFLSNPPVPGRFETSWSIPGS